MVLSSSIKFATKSGGCYRDGTMGCPALGPVVLTTGGLKHRRGQRPRRPTPGCNKCPIRRREFGEKKCRSHSDQQKKGFPQRVYPPGKGQTPQRNFTMTTKWLKGKWALRENLPNRRLRPEEYSPPGKTRFPTPHPPTPMEIYLLKYEMRHSGEEITN